MKKWKSALWNFTKWLLVVTYLGLSLAFVDNKKSMITCSSINIVIADSLKNAFVTKNDVLKAIENKHFNLIGIPISLINTHSIEQQLSGLQAVKSVEAFKTVDGKLTVLIEQRKPMMRVINSKGESYYIDNEGQILPLSSKFTSHVLIVNGNIIEPFDITPNTKIMSWAGKEINDKSPLICKLYDFVHFVTNDPFWKAQITQVYVDSPTSIELIPRVGPHTIIMGSLDNYKKKLAKLKLFYERALPEEGWNKYKEINLKYRNQVVCTKR